MKSTTTSSNMEIVDIQSMDVLCGRGKNSFNHVGNRKFRDIVAAAIPGYVSATSRSVKSEIVNAIVRQVRDGGGRFLKKEGKKGGWYVLNYTQSKEKAGHAIRDATISEESKKNRAKKRKLQRAASITGSSSSGSVRGSECDEERSSPVTVVSNDYEEEQELNGEDHLNLDMNDFNPDDESEEEYMAAVVTPQQEQPKKKQLEPIADHIKSLDDNAEPAAEVNGHSLSNLLMSHFPENLFPDEIPSFGEDHMGMMQEPLPYDDDEELAAPLDPMNSYVGNLNNYVEDLLGPLGLDGDLYM